MGKKRDWVWIVRHDNKGFDNPELYPRAKNPRKRDGTFRFDSEAIVLCGEWLKRITGLSLKPGDCKKVRVKLEVIE